MSEAWIPVLFVAIIVFGVVGGSLMQMVLKELLPLLRGMAQQRQPVPPADVQRMSAALEAVERRLAALEGEHRKLAEDADFVRSLLSSQSSHDAAATGEPRTARF